MTEEPHSYATIYFYTYHLICQVFGGIFFPEDPWPLRTQWRCH